MKSRRQMLPTVDMVLASNRVKYKSSFVIFTFQSNRLWRYSQPSAASIHPCPSLGNVRGCDFIISDDKDAYFHLSPINKELNMH
jgi:hypothetical protein